MSKASALTLPSDPGKPSNRIPEHVKHAIVAAVTLGESKTSVAKRFNTSRQTVSAICAPLQNIPNNPLSTAWRLELTEKLPAMSVDAIKASVMDREDVHKAASTALSHLKGIGVLAGDNQVNVSIQQVIASVPEEWRNEMILTPNTPTSSIDLPTNGAVDAK